MLTSSSLLKELEKEKKRKEIKHVVGGEGDESDVKIKRNIWKRK